MRYVYSEAHLKHRPEHFFSAGSFSEHPESPERATAIAAALKQEGHEEVAPESYGPGPRAAVHAPDYLEFLATIHERWSAFDLESNEVMPNAHPGRHMNSHPTGVVGQAGYYLYDMASPIGANTWEAACVSADVALHATRLVLDGADVCFALTRPPGHHALADMGGGFCYLNNLAIAAQYALAGMARVATLDVDVHHGNGTQGIFYERADVLTISLHCDPSNFYPYFSGYAHERGEGAGRGLNLNLPQTRGAGDDEFLASLERALSVLRSFAPEALFVALGVDGYEGDPFKGLRLTTEGFARIARAIAGLGLPTVIVQEGGYNTDDLGANVVSFLAGFEAGR